MSNSLLHEEKSHYFNAETYQDSQLQMAIKEWTLALGSEAIQQPSLYEKNTIGEARSVPCVLKLRNKEEIVLAQEIARKYSVSYYPISTGNNWGYGSGLPTNRSSVIFDLSCMNKILDFDLAQGTVKVEPGVTQQMLYLFLEKQKASFLVPVTGAGPDCSILGNALERGYGITPHTDHFQAVKDMEAILPNGEIFTSAFTEQGCASLAKLHKWGVGPYLNGLFSQGNFGIVSNITIQLKRKPQCIELFTFKVKNKQDLEQIGKAIKELVSEAGSHLSGVNLMNQERIISMSADYPYEQLKLNSREEVFKGLGQKYQITEWTGIGAIYGTKDIVAAIKKIVKRHLKPFSKKIIFFNRSKLNVTQSIVKALKINVASLNLLIEKAEGALSILEGKPQRVALPLAYWKNKTKKFPGENIKVNPAKDGCGLIWFSPLVPNEGDRLQVYNQIVRSTCLKYGIEPLITFTTLDENLFDSTVPILFDASCTKETKNAKACYFELFQKCKLEGFLPYRLGIQQMDLVVKDTVFWRTASKLKLALDPDNLLGPGRYSLDRA